MSRNKLVIIGAGGHGRVVADIARKSKDYTDLIFLDDSEKVNDKVCVSGRFIDYVKYLDNSDFVVAIGNNCVRADIQQKLESEGAFFATLVHPDAAIGDGVELGRGSVVMAGAVINSCAKIGNGVIVNTCSSVDHDCEIGNYTHISVGSHIAGTVKVGKKVFICAGATVINNVSICDECVIGAGAVVIKNIAKAGTYMGVPAKER